MGYVWQDDTDDDDDDANSNAPAQGEQLPKAARAHLRKVERERDELKKLVEAANADRWKSNVSDVVKAKGFDPKIADLIPTSLDGPEAIGKWIDERSGLFVKATDAPEPTPAEDQIPPELQAQFNMLQNVSSTATNVSKPADLLAKLNDPNLTRDELDKIMRAGGAQF